MIIWARNGGGDGKRRWGIRWGRRSYYNRLEYKKSYSTQDWVEWNNNMEIKTVKIETIIPWVDNPRTITLANLEKLKKRIAEKGLFKPFIVNQDNIILGGNMRYKACVQLGIKEVPILYVETHNDQEMLEIALADNDRSGHYVKKELERLHLKLPELDFEAFNVDLTPPKPLAFAVENNEKPEIEFTKELMEEHNYVVLYFDNEIDWLQLQTLFPLKTVKSLDSKPGFEKMGVGRVVSGAEFIKKIKENEN